MKNKAILLGIMILQALPIPISLITIIGSTISFANIGVVIEQSVFLAVVSTISMLLAGTYTLTYIFSAIKTFSKKKVTLFSFLPIVHILVAIGFFALWITIE